MASRDRNMPIKRIHSEKNNIKIRVITLAYVGSQRRFTFVSIIIIHGIQVDSSISLQGPSTSPVATIQLLGRSENLIISPLCIFGSHMVDSAD